MDRRLLIALGFAGALGAMSACERDGPVEETAEEIDEGFEDAGEEIDDAFDDLEDELD